MKEETTTMSSKRGVKGSLYKSSEQYHQLVDLSPIAISIQKNDKIIFINPAGVKLFGAATPKQLVGRSLNEFLPPEDQKIIMRQLQQVIKKQVDTTSIEGKITRLDGTTVDVEIIAAPFNFQGESAVQIVFHEITQSKKIEELFLQSRQDWEDTFNAITDMITLHDRDFNIIYANKAAEKILNLPLLEIDKTLKCFKYYHGTAGPPEGCPSCQCLKTGKPATFEMFEPHLNMYIEIRAMPRFDRNNQLIGLIHIVRDVTDRKRAEEEIQKAKKELEISVEKRTAELKLLNEQLREEIAERRVAERALRESESKYRNLSEDFHTLLDSIPDNLILLSPELKIIWANKAAASTFAKDVSELTGRYCYELWCNNSSPCENCPTLISLHTGKEENSNISTPEGRLWNIRAFPLKDETGKVKNVIELTRDITEKIKLQAEAMRNRHLASLGELAAGVAHEINNPINNIINYAQILSDEYERENKDNEIARRIIKDGDRIATIVRSLLSFARIRKEEKSLVTLHEIFADTFSLIAAQLRKDSINLKVNIPSHLPEIFVHPQQIQQVFLNIISNSRFALNKKYPESHEDKILDISCKKITIDNHPFVEIVFLDHGTGIPADILDKVMDPFFSTKPHEIGTGLGLSICHGIISEHNGKLLIESIERKFTKVTILLPAQSKI
jgi:PAS domain S-box-containing protein